MTTRKAGFLDWCSENIENLDMELKSYLDKTVKSGEPTKAAICPHAAYRYCGATAAWSFANIVTSEISRVVILGPSHRKPITRNGVAACALPQADVTAYETPFGKIAIDTDAVKELYAHGVFQELPIEDDQKEHSVEMMLPYLEVSMEGKNFKLLPIVVGSLSPKQHKQYADILRPYFADQATIFLISADLCHWGQSYGYTPFLTLRKGTINEAIEELDNQGIDFIERADSRGFLGYLEKTGNTICGKHPISIFLNILEDDMFHGMFVTEKVHYSQSAAAQNARDSSVSYAAIVVRPKAAGSVEM